MTLLTTLQDVAVKIGIDRPSSVIGSTDTTVKELLSFAQEEGKSLSKANDWQILIKEQTFTTTATETQASAIPSDFDRFVNETFWNRSKYRTLTGPLTPQEWQAVKASTISPVTDCFRYRGGSLLIAPTPTAGETMAFEYVSKRTWDIPARQLHDKIVELTNEPKAKE